ncbi:unnamed protein product, partial [Allacma fusca]
CTIKLSNFLDTALTDLQRHFYNGSRNSGPTRVVGHFSEVFSFSGDEGFSDVPTNASLFDILHEMSSTPDVWMMTKQDSKIPQELFVSHGNLLVRGSVGKRGRFSCNVEIANCLNVPLRNRNKLYSNFNDKDFCPLEIQPFHRESFLGSSDTYLEAMFSYEIDSTDLALVIALKVVPGANSCAAAFSQIPAVTEKKDLEALMNPGQWKIHDYKTVLNASNTLE